VRLYSNQSCLEVTCSDTVDIFDPGTAQDIAAGFLSTRFSIVQNGTSMKMVYSSDESPTLCFNLPPEIVIEPGNSGKISVNGNEYRGSIFVRNKGGDSPSIEVINILDIEDYIRGTIRSEISPAWPQEAIKAHIVAARTYALYQMQNRKKEFFDVEANVLSQVYQGCAGEDSAADELIRATKGEFLTYRNEVAQVFYHSCCGGYTEDSLDVWGISIPYLKSVRCPFCKDSPPFYWERKFTSNEIQEMMKRNGLNLGSIIKIWIKRTSRTGRIMKLGIRGTDGEEEITGERFRRIMGYSVIPSTLFTIEQRSREEFIFTGRGYGHGVGMCQWGARGMALSGYDYREILRYYYPGTKINRMDVANNR